MGTAKFSFSTLDPCDKRGPVIQAQIHLISFIICKYFPTNHITINHDRMMTTPTILAFAASTSTQSINKKFAEYAAHALPDVTVRVIDLNDFAAPMYSVDAEASDGIPASAKTFVAEIESADGIILSLAEHNGSYSAAFKSIFDWGTRHKHKIWSDKPMLLLSTSPGARGGATVLEAAANSFPHLGAKVAATFSLPSYGENFSIEKGIRDEALKTNFARKLAEFRSAC